MSTEAIDKTGTEGEEGEGTPLAVPWLPDADEETVEYLRSRGWDKDPSGALRAQKEAEKALRLSQQAQAANERELAEARENLAAASKQRGGEDQDPFGVLAAAEAYENGEITMGQFAQYQNAAVLSAAKQMAEEIVGQRVDPLANRQHTADLQTTATEIAATYPDFAELSDEVLALMQRNPAKYSDPEGMWAAYGLVKSRKQVAEARQRKDAEGSETLDSGSRGHSYEDASEAIRKELRGIAAPTGRL